MTRIERWLVACRKLSYFPLNIHFFLHFLALLAQRKCCCILITLIFFWASKSGLFIDDFESYKGLTVGLHKYRLFSCLFARFFRAETLMVDVAHALFLREIVMMAPGYTFLAFMR